MKIDSALRMFSEKYDRVAMESIDNLSQDFGLTYHNHKIKLFNLKESIDLFNNYLKGYASYMIENKDNENSTPREGILESVNGFIKGDDLFVESDVLYANAAKFVESYISGVQTLLETVDEVKNLMMENGIDLESVGDVNDFMDTFMDRLHESFDPAMDRLLWASGYNAKKKLESIGRQKEEKPVFI